MLIRQSIAELWLLYRLSGITITGGLLNLINFVSYIMFYTVYADIPMESIDHSSTVMGNGVHTYDTLKQIDGQTTIPSIIAELNNSDDKDTANGTVGNGNGDLLSNLPSVAIYERPIFSQSQHESTFNVSHYCTSNRCMF